MNLDLYLKSNPKKFLIFDLDATILKLQLPWSVYIDPLRKTLEKIDPKILESRDLHQISLSELQNEYMHKGEDMIHLIKNYNEHFESQLKHYDPNSHLIDFIRNDTSHILFLWTSNCRTTAEKTLKMEGIHHHFEKLVTASDVTFIKPDIEGFSQIYLKGNNLSDYVLIGDSKADSDAASTAGIDFFEINYFKLIA